MKRGKWEIKMSFHEESVLQNNGTYQRELYWWRYVAPNGKIICVSEMYTTEAAARKGIASVKRGVLNPVVFSV